MSFAQVLKKFSQPNSRSNSPGASGSGPDDSDKPSLQQQACGSMPSKPRLWRMKRPPTPCRSDSFQQTSTHPLTPKTGDDTSENGVIAMPFPAPLPTTPDVFATNPDMAPPLEIIPTVSPVPDRLVEAWDAIKDGPSIPKANGAPDAIADAVSTTRKTFEPVLPIISATVTAAQQTDICMAIKDGINKLSEGIPILMRTLDELKSLHPFIGVIVLAFKTVYELEHNRYENDNKVISLYIGMRDMMGALLLLKDVKNDKVIAPDGISVEDRLKSLVERTADDIKMCSNVCDAYTKKRLLAKVLLSTAWDVKLLSFVQRFAQRRQEFQFELTMHINQGVDKAHVKLDAIGDATRELSEQMDAMKALFQQLVSPEQKRLSELVAEKGGFRVLRDDKVLLDLEVTANESSRQPSVEGPQGKTHASHLKAENLRNDILEDPDAAVEKNWTVFSRKFELQKNQIIDKLTFVVQRESDRVIREVKGSAHERIRDRSIHEIWVEMDWRGNVKARHFVLALRDYYLEKLSGDIIGTGTSAINSSSDPDAWAIKFIDVMWVRPILEAFDDDASGFITIAEVNTFTCYRPVEWSLPHWLAFWAVGFKWSIIDYARKIEDLFARMQGVRTTVLPPNREAVDKYCDFVWNAVHTLTVPATSLSSGLDSAEKFKLHLEAEEARLDKNLRAVDYVIDGIDTLTLLTGGCRIERTLFPLIYLLMKRHYEIMRIMRTKVVNFRDLFEGAECISHVLRAVTHRVEDLTNNFCQQSLDPEKEFQKFAYGIFKYIHNRKALWTVDYIRGHDHQVIPYEDDNEDQDVEPGCILNYGYRDELSVDNGVYDGHSFYDIPGYCDVEPPLKDIFGHWHGYLYNSKGHRKEGESMMTFVLVPAKGEQDIKADGWSLQGRYKITGSWSQGENGVIQIRLRMYFLAATWAPKFFKGYFDAERDALMGVWGFSAELESSKDKMECRRIPPHYLTVYPNIKELSDNKPRALWRFAIEAVRNDRRDDRETTIPLLVRDRYFGPPLRDEDTETLYAISPRLTSADACFYSTRANHIRAYTWVHENAWCDSCDGRIGGPRLFCIDCASKRHELYARVDLCCAPQCVDARVTNREEIECTHEPSHRLIKARTPVLTRCEGTIHMRASDAFRRMQVFCMKIAEISSSQEESRLRNQKTSSSEPTSTEAPAKVGKLDDVHTTPDCTKGGVEVEDKTVPDAIQDQMPDQDLPTCGKCDSGLSFPFWYCMFCEDDLFICNTCDAEGVPDLVRCSGRHTERHHLVRCLAPEKAKDKPLPTEERLTAIECRLNGMQAQLDGLTNRVEDLNANLTSRIGNIEQLLHRLLVAPAPGNAA